MLLEVDNLVVQFKAHDQTNKIHIARTLNGVSLNVSAGEVLGIVGESGSGKTMTINAILRLLPRGAEVAGGTVAFGGKDLTKLSEPELRRIRGKDISVITQSPLAGLDPLCRVGEQLVRVRLAHSNCSRKVAESDARDMMRRVGIPDPARRMKAWPHELSGGMAQRIVIAMALMNQPRLLIADEPTTGLDSTVQIQVLNEFRAAVDDYNLAAILVTHDMGVVAHYCDRVCVMYAGTVVEDGPVKAIFEKPAHPYTAALIEASQGRGMGAGTPPDLYGRDRGCVYRDLCARSTDLCATAPALRPVGASHNAACHYAI
jgi:oligopeptide/dipeptide ABC transporter ATP-binding protein